MNERERMWAMLQRVKALCDRNTAEICQCIQTRTNLHKLDELFTLSERAHQLYRRVYVRYEAML